MEQDRVVIGIVPNGDEVLVVIRGKDDGFHHSFPSGSIKEGESIEDAARREVLEETGIVTKFVSHLGTKPHRIIIRKQLYYCLLGYEEGTPTTENDKNIERAGRIKKTELVEFLGTNIFDPVKQALDI